MSSRKLFSRRNTLAFRLTLWYAGIFTVSSCIAFLLFYTLITSVIRERSDEELLNQANRFVTLYDTEGINEVAKSAVIEAQAAGVRKVFFRLVSPEGEIFSSSNMSYWINIAVRPEAIQALLQGAHQAFETIVIPNRKDEVRVLYVMLSPGIIMQIGQTMENYSRFFGAFKGIFITTMTFLIFLAAGVGWFMARRAVSGVEAVTEAARKISGSTFEERVPVNMRGDEIDQLAITFNEMLDRIQTLLKEMKEISDNIAHDLKSPITRMRGAAEVALTTGTSLGEFESMAASTIEECDRLLDMINTMLLISRTEAGTEITTLKSINISEVVANACELFTPGAEDKGIMLHCSISDGIYLNADTRMVQRMFSNLFDNAIKYTPSGGSVSVDVSENVAGQVTISVSDTGMGIPPADLPHIFERFYRGDQSRSLAGIGLGLSLARAIARSYDGDITVISVPGQGSTFTISLPKK
jgi:heavy metal sensor kinase